jgi:succinate dehydrogenase / fumarate reductase membrane anchor subunit
MSLSASYSQPKPSGGLALWSWVFMRVSGIVLLFLALGHLVLMHLIHSVDEINYAFVANRYAGWFWRGYDLSMLLLAMLHGIAGMRIIILDYVHPPLWRRLSLMTVYAGCGGLMILGTAVALFFKPMIQ